MAKTPHICPYVRLRQRPDDTALYVTEAGRTISGHLTEASRLISRGACIGLRFDEAQRDFCGTAIDDWTVEIPIDRILAADADALDFDRMPAGRELEQLLAEHRTMLLLGDPPPCEHEDVIDITELVHALAQGMCLWCGQRMVAEQCLEVTRGPWTPA